ncbi:DUF695 domain-containing protein [Roseibium sp. RKSG952]|uniref:DUF695 domain-containing protein n=1 Tax=Roseibium sp. RKSG952 TaxID=2529384 RepID=UPI0012BC1326|nr:DUF695 domain-containing protein [Roseibium sp. RKSG952]MTH94782.1 DUF695 domain-containing protein [Roseibium sp. RKSG952]
MSPDRSTDCWDFYSCEIEGKPHSTMVNLSLFEFAPIPKLNMFHCLEITLKHPNPEHGMATNEEFQPLSDIEDLICRSETEDLMYIARQTGGGKRSFCFYASPEFDFVSFTDVLGQAFPGYEITTFNFKDTDWQTYFGNLYPNTIGMNEISNRSVFLQLEANGDNLDIPREIDHTVIFENRNQANEFSMIAEGRGFTVEIKTSGTFRKTYDLLVQRVDPPSRLDPITYELQELAVGLGGSYDGWGCSVQTSSDS